MVQAIIIAVLAVALIISIVINRRAIDALMESDTRLFVAHEIISRYINLVIEYYGAETAKNILDNVIKGIGNSEEFGLVLPVEKLSDRFFSSVTNKENDNGLYGK